MASLRFYLNDALVVVEHLSPTMTLLRYLREEAGLSGTKEGCAEGDCGACSVVLLDAQAIGGPSYRTVNACLLLLPMVHGKRVYTVEGLASRGVLHPAQTAIHDAAGSQCGYCTPGFVSALFEASYREDLDADWKLDDQLSGNLCRCTGYRPLKEALRKVAGSRPADAFRERLSVAPEEPQSLVYETAGALPRPGEGEAQPSADRLGAQKYFRPIDYDALFDALDQNPDARIVCGGTDIGLEITKQGKHPACLVSLEAVAPFRKIRATELGVRVGAAVTLSELEHYSQRELPMVARMLRYFGSRPIKQRATLGGNLCNASPIGDLPPVTLAMEATMIARTRHGERSIPAADFFVDYRKTALLPGEVLAAVEFSRLSSSARFAAYKVSKRQELDISSVAACFYIDTEKEEATGREIVTQARLAFGGLAATPKRAARTEAFLIGKDWSEELVRSASAELELDFSPIDDHRASARYRRSVARNLMLGFFHESLEERWPQLPARPTATVGVA